MDNAKSERIRWYDKKTQPEWHLPITELSRLIGAKWFLPIERLAAMAGVSMDTIKKALRGKRIHICDERKIRKFLMNYKGEVVCLKNLPKMD